MPSPTRAVEAVMRAPRFLAAVAAALALSCDSGAHTTTIPDADAAPVCRARVQPQELLPSDAVVVGMYDMALERRFAPRRKQASTIGLRALLPLEMEAVRAGWIGIAAACELDDAFWGEAWLALDRDEELVAVISGRGVGDAKNLRCIRGRLAQWDEDFVEDVSIASEGCGVALQYDDIVGFAPSDDLLVLGSPTAVAKAKSGENTARGGAPAALMPPKRNKSYVWAAANIDALMSPDEVGEVLTSTGRDDLAAMVNIASVTGQATLARRYTLELSGKFGAQADARAAAAVLGAWIASPPPILPPWAQQVVRRVQLTTRDTDVTIALPLGRDTAQELGLLPSKVEAEQMPMLVWLVGIALAA